ncbi:family 43 glycosylhydrolase [Plebeiibacterium sediminum]|uniref:Family 43 glycosylhydrolase n=1 Tax=Plebeiibacterium sediminum TaxID=2992112 RepID=A0AAE3M6B9_9BACT|nr:family 43 glycosylhydrolase [Plebeiobacterium sediminum]MCW3787924.1 family 43 glycosylhydrolase [Plebeiobacterium sediminum]
MNFSKTLIAIVFACLSITAVSQDKIVNSECQFLNPVFAGDYPDPSILVDGDDYYVVHSSFEYYPGLLIWHSTDLINWTPVANALYTYVGSVWAPDLVKYDGKYYIYFPADNTNYVITAESIEGPWSEPVELNITMIDPGHVVDEEGNRYLYFSSGSYVPLSKDGLSVAGDVQHVYDGWDIPRDWSIECFCMEGPKLFKRGEYYYLTVAEGGTAGPATGHMVISARSKSPLGPWENSPYNPIIRAKSNEDKWWSVGHATPFKDTHDKWWMMLHGYEKDFYNMGRQTMLAPIEWTADGWFKTPEGYQIDAPADKPEGESGDIQFSLNDDFSGSALKPQWKFFKGYDEERFKVENNSIVINGKGGSVADCSPMLCIPEDHAYTAQVELEVEGDAVGGMVLFYNERAFSGILADKENVLANLRGWQFATESNVLKRYVFLRLKNINNTVDMYYSLDGEQWNKIENSFEASAYHHNVLSGFMSLRIGLCAMGKGNVTFKNFEYKPL